MNWYNFIKQALRELQHGVYGFNIGDKVQVISRDNFGTKGVVTGFETNMFGKALIAINAVYPWAEEENDIHDLVFYPYELEKIDS